jgi:hypothetical protein
MSGKTIAVYDALQDMHCTDVLNKGMDILDWYPLTQDYTTKEGGIWVDKNPANDIACTTPVHAIRMKDGRVWDAVNGWRKSPKPTLADDISFKPSTRRILAHLQARGSITVLEALAAYGTARIAPAIHDLREGGYSIETVKKADAGGHNYTRYVLAA